MKSPAPEPHLRCYTLFYETVENVWPVPNRESWNHFPFYGRHTYPRGEMTAICELEKVKEGIISFSWAVKAKVKLYNIAKQMCIFSSTSKFISHVMYYGYAWKFVNKPYSLVDGFKQSPLNTIKGLRYLRLPTLVENLAAPPTGSLSRGSML